ncbi:MAG: isoaspartyl peptidase/L-asparaginase [Parvularculaceae bacterium]
MARFQSIICGLSALSLSACALLPMKSAPTQVTDPTPPKSVQQKPPTVQTFIWRSDKLCRDTDKFGVILHGGTARAGKVPQERLDFMQTLLGVVEDHLSTGGTAVDSAAFAIIAMEDSGLFNAGKAAISNRDGYVETDASIMNGATMKSGAVGSMITVKNPINAARLVMDETPHAMMVGTRGETAVVALGAKTVPAEYFTNNKQTTASADTYPNHGTVGAAVLDRCGNMAAGTSTGGYNAKIPGRVGDSPIIGASTYAKNGVMAASATGHGEYFIRYTATRTVAARMEYGGESLAAAAAASIREMAQAGGGTEGKGGIIAIDARGNFAYPFSTDGMVRGLVSNDKPVQVGVFEAME